MRKGAQLKNYKQLPEELSKDEVLSKDEELRKDSEPDKDHEFRSESKSKKVKESSKPTEISQVQCKRCKRKVYLSPLKYDFSFYFLSEFLIGRARACQQGVSRGGKCEPLPLQRL